MQVYSRSSIISIVGIIQALALTVSNSILFHCICQMLLLYIRTFFENDDLVSPLLNFSSDKLSQGEQKSI